MKTKEITALKERGVIAVPSRKERRNGKDVVLYDIYSRR